MGISYALLTPSFPQILPVRIAMEYLNRLLYKTCGQVVEST
jgi:hypothetical protein